MRCKECGIEVDNEKAFCPVCGSPMKVTADYEYIQAEIANKVDRFFNDDTDEENNKNDSDELELGLFIDVDEKADSYDLKRSSSKKSSRRSDRDDFAKTRKVYGNDSVFDDEMLSENSYEEEEYEDTYYADERQRNTRRRPPEEENRRPSSRNKRPDIRDDYYEPKDQTAAKILTVLIIFVIIAACAVGVMAVTGVFKNKDNTERQVQGISSIVCNVTAGDVVSDPVRIELSSSADGNIFYTIDGTEPNLNSPMYTGPFTITAADVERTYPSVSLRAVSYSADSVKSGDLNISFQFEYDEEAAPVVETETVAERTSLEIPQIVPESGSYNSDINITVISPDGADIFYTYDGSVPTAASTRYTGAVKMIPGSSVFSAVCIDGNIVSQIATANYELDYGFDTSPDAAITAVENDLLWNGYIADYDLNTYDGGHAEIKHLGVYLVGDYTYYIIEVDIFGEDGIIDETLLRGVGVNYGNVYGASRDGNSFIID